MSVIESNRTKSPLETSVKARDLACYTIKISINEKIFDPKYKTVITDKIVSDAIDIYRKVWMANNIKVNKNQDAWTKRSKLQMEAKDLCNDMLALVGIAKPLFHLTSKRIEYWTGRVIEVREMIKSWHESDKKRYLGM